MNKPEQCQTTGKGLNLRSIGCVSTLLSNIKEIEKDQKWRTGQQAQQYYRGLSDVSYTLKPSVMRDKKHYKTEGTMLRDLITRQPDEFAKFPSALDQWMLAQHHGLYTRFLDISANPLVGLFFACGGSKDDGPKDDETDGRLYVFATTRDRVKPYDSDAVSIIANFAQLRRCEQKEILHKTKKFLEHREAFINVDRGILGRNEPEDIVKEVEEYYKEYYKRQPARPLARTSAFAWLLGCLRFRGRFLARKDNEASGDYSYMGRLWTLIKREKPYFVEDLIKPRDLFRIFIVQPRLLFPRVIAQSGAFLVSAHHEMFNFEWKEQNGRLPTGQYDVPYNYYQLRVEGGRKKCILKELESLNISTETLFPGLESSAKAIVKANESKDDSQKLTVTFELRRSNERPAVVRYGGHCLEIYSNRIVYRRKRRLWKDIMDTTEECKTYASVPLTSKRIPLGRFDDKIDKSFERSDYIHFPITNLNEDPKGDFFVSSSGVAWVGQNGRSPQIIETKSWAEFHEWMTCKRPDEPARDQPTAEDRVPRSNGDRTSPSG